MTIDKWVRKKLSNRMKEIFSHQDLIREVGNVPKSYVLLYKPGSGPNDCALENIRLASGKVEEAKILFADVSAVRDIHSHYGVNSVPSLLVFEKGRFRNVIKGCNDNNYYKTLFEDAVFASIKAEGKPMKSVTVYSTPTCTWCNTLKTYLRKNRIPYEDVDVSRDPNAAEELVRRTGQQGVPQTDIGGTIVVGFDKKRINELLGING